jgi:hypothetical protein
MSDKPEDAAAEIARLQAEIKKLETALKRSDETAAHWYRCYNDAEDRCEQLRDVLIAESR